MPPSPTDKTQSIGPSASTPKRRDRLSISALITGSALLAIVGASYSLAAFPTRVLPISVVIDPLADGHSMDRVALHAERMRAGDRFPPISVIRLAGRYLVADGHKRLTAYKMLAKREIWLIYLVLLHVLHQP